MLERDSQKHIDARDVYLSRFPDAASLFEFSDFNIVIIKPMSARVIAGFGRAITITGDDFSTTVPAAADSRCHRQRNLRCDRASPARGALYPEANFGGPSDGNADQQGKLSVFGFGLQVLKISAPGLPYALKDIPSPCSIVPPPDAGENRAVPLRCWCRAISSTELLTRRRESLRGSYPALRRYGRPDHREISRAPRWASR